MVWRFALALTAVGTLAGLVASSSGSGGQAVVVVPQPRVTLITDSVAGAIALDTGATADLAQGIDLFLEPGQARILGGKFPPGDGAIAPASVVDLIGMLGRNLGPVVVIAVGYNDITTDYAANMEVALAALRASAVRRVLWVTLRVSPNHTSYETVNAAIRVAATQHPEITVVDWNANSAPRPDWFQQDGVHLVGEGPRALSQLIRATLVRVMG